MPKHPDRSVRTWRSMVRGAAAVGQVLRRGLQDCGLSAAQLGVLGVVVEAGDGGIKLSDIGERLLVTCGNITGLVDRLEEEGYVAREAHPSDRRAILAKSTPKGRGMYADIAPAHRERIVGIMSCLSTKEQKTLRKLLGRVADRADTIGGPE